MILLNFSHPLTDDHLTQIEALAGLAVTRVICIHAQVDPDRDLSTQVSEMANAAGLSPIEWQTLPLLAHLPGYAPAAAALVAELHGRMGHFPAILTMRHVKGAKPALFEVAEVLDLQRLRDQARRARI